jgi:hypothetical protein
MVDTECGIDADCHHFPEGRAAKDPTGKVGWDMLTIEADRAAEWDGRSYEEILAAKAQDVLAWELA